MRTKQKNTKYFFGEYTCICDFFWLYGAAKYWISYHHVINWLDSTREKKKLLDFPRTVNLFFYGWVYKLRDKEKYTRYGYDNNTCKNCTTE